jgi:hypothetical protein
LHAVFDIFMGGVIFLSVVAVMLGSVADVHDVLAREFHIFDMITVGIFSVEYLFRVYCCVENPDYEEPVVGRLRYMVSPAALVDLATLTGACMVGLGPNYSGLFTAHDDLAADLQRAAEAAGELIWRLPLDKKLGDSIKSQRGDIKNLGGPYGGAITGALFLQHFVGDTRWAHLDIAGPALADKDDGHIRAGGTGHGVLTLWSLVEAASA